MKMVIMHVVKKSVASRRYPFSLAFLFLLIRAADFQFPVAAERDINRIDCGLSVSSNITNEVGLSYVPDDGFIQTGENKQIQAGVNTTDNTVPIIYRTLRSFPNYTRNCYSLPAIPEKRYMIRASFMYGNYDGLNKVPTFDIYYGVDLWDTIKLDSATHMLWKEMVVQAAAVERVLLYVCLVNTGSGIPFISGLEQRLLDDDFFGPANRSQNIALTVFRRMNIGAKSEVRHPDDRYDRIWSFDYDSYGKPANQSKATITNTGPLGFYVPSPVFQTAVYAPTIALSLPGSVNVSYYLALYFADLVQRPGMNPMQRRPLKLTFNRDDYGNAYAFYEVGYVLYISKMLNDAAYDFSIVPANASDPLGAVLNGYEAYRVNRLKGDATFSQDVDAIESIRDHYRVNKSWAGDPCLPKGFAWDGLICNRDIYGNQIIVELDLSNSGLKGLIIGNFSDMTNLKKLNLSGNSLCGSIPRSLQERATNGELKLSIENNLPRCPTNVSNSSDKGKIVVVSILSSLLVVAVLLLIVLLIMMRMKNRKQGGKTSIAEQKTSSFSYDEIIQITDDFKRIVGKGGSGKVYYGHLKNSEEHSSSEMKDGYKEVAVKVMEGSLSQGIKEFTAEVQLLMQVHHKNLASFIGFCNEGNKMILVYDYMSRGNLREMLSGSESLLNWVQRLQIALAADTGLDYLHSGCRTPIIHRDVKTSNILINENFEAKIADFGLSKIGKTDYITHITTAAAGTPGYMDPEYYNTSKLTEKSDVYSFGVVLFELITGRCPILNLGSETALHIVKWVTPQIMRGDVASIVDHRLHGQFDINSAWKMIDIAMACSEEKAIARPTMTEVVNGLREALDIENRRGRAEDSFTSKSNSLPSSSQNRNDLSDSCMNPSAR